MKFALVNGQRQEAQPQLSGKCPGCGSPMIAKCGDVRRPHWAHKGKRFCDPWWENETDWHRAWKELFPRDWQEVVHYAENGEKHIADVKTDHDWIIEFQHSRIKPDERRSRDAFYKKLVWVVDGTRLKRDGAQLARAWRDGISVGGRDSPTRQVFIAESRLVSEWVESDAPIFFDFGEPELWWLLARSPGGMWAYVARFSRTTFVQIHRGEAPQEARNFDEFAKDISNLIAQYESNLRFRR
jgi:hypothetical protein